MKKRLLDDVLVEELLRMRESGMTNNDIATSLGVCYGTIYKAIGPQPGRGGRVSQWVDRTPKMEKGLEGETVEAAAQSTAEPEPCLLMVNQVIRLEGDAAKYGIDMAGKSVLIQVGTQGIEVGFDALSRMQQELTSILYHLEHDKTLATIW